MAEDMEKRMEQLESRLDGHLTVIHEFIDELRADRDIAKQQLAQNDRRLAQNEHRLAQNEAQILRLSDLQVRLIDTQSDTAKILRGMNGKLTDHEDRLTALGSAPAS